ncbi:MAG: sugar transferase [Chitinophagales bacterium]
MFYPSSQQVPLKKEIEIRQTIGIGVRGYFFWKRAFDLFVAALLIVTIMTWLIPLVSILILLDSKGTIFFCQKRIGRKGKVFQCIKFRTMIKNPEADEKQAVENDARITGLGKFLRKSNIDEFPQLFNVLLGQMSMVGPRPHMVSDCIKFSLVIRGYTFRDLMRPGMTGLSQVKGFCGPMPDWTSLYRRYQLDAFYIGNANFWLDLRIIQRTAIQRTKFLIRYFSKARVARQASPAQQ